MRDGVGNPTNDFVWHYTWQHGRQLASMHRLGTSEDWQFTYNADGLRTQRKKTGTDSDITYNYTYLGSQLTHMTVDGHTMYFAYDAAGTPMSLTYDGVTYYYVTNLQGDVVAILNSSGTEVVRYAYDAWGKIIKVEGSATNLRYYNPLRYRGYVYDPETELYYLQSRYYNPEMGRFINGDTFASTGQGLLGNNMFAYCANNPVCRKDITGTRYCEATSVANESAAARSVACQFQGSVASERQTASKNTLIFTGGYYVCFTVGAFNISGTIELSFDLKGNTQLFSTASFDVTTSGSLSISGGSTSSVLLAPDTSYVKGDADYLGGGIACPIPYTPIAGTASTNILRTSDGYWGFGKTTGVAWPADSKVGGEFHGGHSYSHAWLPQVNLFDFFNVF